MTPEFSNMSN